KAVIYNHQETSSWLPALRKGCAERWIALTESLVGFLHHRRGSRIRRNLLRHAHDCATCFINRRPHSAADSGQNRCPVCRALFRREYLHLALINVGLDLPPQSRTRSASSESDPFHWDSHFVKDRETVFQTESHALQDRPYYVCASVSG